MSNGLNATGVDTSDVVARDPSSPGTSSGAACPVGRRQLGLALLRSEIRTSRAPQGRRRHQCARRRWGFGRQVAEITAVAYNLTKDYAAWLASGAIAAYCPWDQDR